VERGNGIRTTSRKVRLKVLYHGGSPSHRARYLRHSGVRSSHPFRPSGFPFFAAQPVRVDVHSSHQDSSIAAAGDMFRKRGALRVLTGSANAAAE
jgi:hypothetical protein